MGLIQGVKSFFRSVRNESTSSNISWREALLVVIFKKLNTLCKESNATEGSHQAQQSTTATIPQTKAQKIRSIAETTFTGVGQIIFGDKPLTGALFFAGILVANPLVAVAGLIGSAVGSLTARALKYDRDNIKQGLYGFNAALVPMAVFTWFAPTLPAIGVAVAACAASTFVANRLSTVQFFKDSGIPSFTTPFILMAWTANAVGTLVGLNPNTSVPSSVFQGVTEFAKNADLFGALHALGQVMFQGSNLTGAFFLVGLALSSRKLAVASLGGALLAGAIAQRGFQMLGEVLQIGLTEANINSGIFGYNAALAAAAMVVFLKEQGSFKKVAMAGGAALLTLPLLIGFTAVGAPALTAPFVVSAVACLWWFKRQGQQIS